MENNFWNIEKISKLTGIDFEKETKPMFINSNKNHKYLRILFLLMFTIFVLSIGTEIYAKSSRYVSSLTVKNRITLNVGDTEYVPVKINVVGKVSRKIKYKVSNKSIVNVRYNNKTSKITCTGVKSGTTKITITTKARNKKGKKIKKSIKVIVLYSGEKSERVKTTEQVKTEEKPKQEKSKFYSFRKPSYLTEHYEKHGIEMGYSDENAYLAGANAVINNPKALHKLEAEDNDHIYYLEDTNEIVFLSQDGYIRTYFICSGKDYYEKQ